MSKIWSGKAGTAGALAAGGVAAAVIVVALLYVNQRGSTPTTAAQTSPDSGTTVPASGADISAAVRPVVAPEAGPIAVGEPKDATPSVQSQEVDTAVPTEDAQAASDPESRSTEAEPLTAAAPIAPAFDEVRREEDGLIVIAGRAAPGATVTVLQDGRDIAVTSADGSGKFAALAMVPPDGQGHVLSLLQSLGDSKILSEDQIVLAPTEAPATVAEAATDPAPSSPSGEMTVDQAVAEAVLKIVEKAETATQGAVSTASTADAQGPYTSTTVPAVAADPAVPQPASQPEIIASVQSGETPQAQGAEPEQSSETVAPADTDNPETAEGNSASEPATTSAAASDAPETASTEVAVLKSTPEGVELLNVPKPEVMSSVALDTISYSDAGEVQLAGRAQPATSSIRVYLNNNAVVSLPVDDAGRWRGDLPEVDEGIYTLRVDEVSADGSVSSRVETPFKRESPEVLAAAAAGKDGAVKSITVQKGHTLWAIARDRYGDGMLYVRVFKANQSEIRNPDLIYPGQVFDLPK